MGSVGFEIARSFAELGADVTIAMRDETKAQATIDEIKKSQVGFQPD